MGTALVTGASAGLGRALAVELARRGHDVVLVARDEQRLARLGTELTRDHGVRAEVLATDLADRDALSRVADRVADPRSPVDLLVNNAGFGIRTPVSTGALPAQEKALDVMVRAVLVLSHAAASSMRERGHGAILNVSSVAGFTTMGSYAAIKAWVTVFTEALATELAGTGVSVTALCPGFVRTEFHQRAGLDLGRLPPAAWLSAERVARDALADVSAGAVLSVPSLRYRGLVGVLRFLPRSHLRRVSHALVAGRAGTGPG